MPVSKSDKEALEAKRESARLDAKRNEDIKKYNDYLDAKAAGEKRSYEQYRQHVLYREKVDAKKAKADQLQEQRKQKALRLEEEKNKEAQDNFTQQTKASKSIASAEKNLEKVQKSRNNSLSTMVGNLIQGNFEQIRSNQLGKKALVTELLLAKQTEDTQKSLKDIEGFNALEVSQKGEVRDLVKGIQDGIYGQTDAKSLLNKLDSEGVNISKELRTVIMGTAKAGDDNKEAQEAAAEEQEEFARNVGLATISFGALAGIVNQVSSVIDDIGKSFGSLVVFSDEFKKNVKDAGTDAIALGGSLQDTIDITKSLTSEFGLSLDEAVDLSSKVFDTSKALGLSTQEGANLFGVLMQTANLSAEQAESLAEGTFQLAAQAGVAPTAVMQDIASSSEAVATFTKDGGDNIARAAVQARALGVSLDTSAKIAEGLLDFESSIRAEQEASVMIGRQINLQKAREAALNNDIEGAMKAVVAELGSEAEFNKLNILQRQSLAKSIGVSTAELAKFVGKQDEVNSLSDELSKGSSFSDLLGRDSISQLTQFINGFKALTAEVLNSLGPALETIGGLFSGIAGFLRENAFAMKILGIAAGGLAISLGIVAVKSAAAAMAGIPFIGPALAIGAILAISSAINSGISKVNDFQAGPGGISYMSGPAGSFQLNPKDSVLATTNPIPVQKVNEYPSAGSLKPMEQSTINNTQQVVNNQQPVANNTPPEIKVNVQGVTRGKDIHYITKNRPISGGDAGFGSLA